MAQEYRCIARVVKTHGIKGEVVAVPAGGLPPVLSQGLEVCLVPPSLRGNRWHKVLEVTSSDTGQLVLLSDVSDTSAAHELVGKYMLARTGELEATDNISELEELIGLEVVDRRLGMLGKVEEIYESPAQDILVVRSERGETMIPMVDELVWLSDDESTIESDIPVGLAPWDTGEGM